MATAQTFPTYKIHKWTDSNQKSDIIVQCSNQTTIGDPRTELPSSFVWETSATVSDGNLSLSRSFYFTIKNGVTVRPREIPPVEVFRAEGFPKKFSRLPEDKRFVYKGNGELSKLNGDIDSAIWVYRAEYVFDPNSDDEDENTKPWNRKPYDVSLAHPEVQKSFLYAYNDNNELFVTTTDKHGNKVEVPADPVVNAAGDRFELLRTKTNLQLNFTYNIRPELFNINDVVQCQHSINKSKIKVIGIEIQALQGYLENMEPRYNIDDNGRGYWALSTSILIDKVGDGFKRRIMEVGNRAKWPSNVENTVGDNGVIDNTGRWGKLSMSSQGIYGWWSWDTSKPSMGQFASGSKFQVGNGQQLQQAKQKFDRFIKPILGQEFVYEKMEDVPLDLDGTVWFESLDPDSPHYKDYYIKTFQEHPQVDWKSLNMPTNGVRW